jgi:hypothetical protein
LEGADGVMKCPACRQLVTDIGRCINPKCDKYVPISPMSDAGRKDDQGKLRYDLLLPSMTRPVVRVLTHGAEKYGDHNWSKVERLPSRYYAACQRHLDAWRDGERVDPESGLPHLAHAICCLMFLLAHEGER